MTTITIRDKTNGGRCPKCDGSTGTLATVGPQDTVRCATCDHFLYCAPKTETGRAQRSTSTVHAAIRPNQRSRILERANARCERCGKPAAATVTGLQVGHILSVDDGLRHGLSEDVINSDDNLIAECDECNSGHGAGSLPVRLFVTLLMARNAGGK